MVILVDTNIIVDVVIRRELLLKMEVIQQTKYTIW